jgi:hypothetical protein
VHSVANGICFTSKSPVDLEVKQVPFDTLCAQSPDDGLKMGPKYVEGW